MKRRGEWVADTVGVVAAAVTASECTERGREGAERIALCLSKPRLLLGGVW